MNSSLSTLSNWSKKLIQVWNNLRQSQLWQLKLFLLMPDESIKVALWNVTWLETVLGTVTKYLMYKSQTVLHWCCALLFHISRHKCGKECDSSYFQLWMPFWNVFLYQRRPSKLFMGKAVWISPQVLHIMWISHVGHLCWSKRRNRTATPPPSRFTEQAPSANESNRSLKVFGRTSGLARNWPLFFSQTGRITASLVTGWAQQLCSCKK